MDRKRFLIALAALPASCVSEAPPRSSAMADFTLTLGWGQPSSVELHVHRAGERWRLRVRRRSATSWPPLFAATFASELSPNEIIAFASALERSGFFSLPPVIETRQLGVPLHLSVRQRGRAHRVVARGRSQPALDRAIRAIDDHLPIALPPLPSWMRGASREPRGRPVLVDDHGAAIAFHSQWLAEQPERSALHMDLFALLVATGERDKAREQLRFLERDPTLRGLVPELRRLLGTAHDRR